MWGRQRCLRDSGAAARLTCACTTQRRVRCTHPAVVAGRRSAVGANASAPDAAPSASARRFLRVTMELETRNRFRRKKTFAWRPRAGKKTFAWRPRAGTCKDVQLRSEARSGRVRIGGGRRAATPGSAGPATSVAGADASAAAAGRRQVRACDRPRVRYASTAKNRPQPRRGGRFRC